VSDVLYGFARSLNGSGLEDAELVKLARDELLGIPFSIVRQWLILDISVSAEECDKISAEGLQPSVLFSHTLVYDSAGNTCISCPGISGYLKLHKGCFFEDQNRLYILAGSGARRNISIPAMDALNVYIHWLSRNDTV
jgi:hypothetical protein